MLLREKSVSFYFLKVPLYCDAISSAVVLYSDPGVVCVR